MYGPILLISLDQSQGRLSTYFQWQWTD